MKEKRRYSNQQPNSTFQPQIYRQSGFEQVNPGRTEMHSSSDPGNGNKNRDSIHKIQTGDTLWDIAEDKLGSGSRWTELQKKDGNAFTNQEVHHLQVGTEIYLPKVGLANGSPHISGLQPSINDFKANPNAITLEIGASGDRAINSLKANSNPSIQPGSISFSGAKLIKAVRSNPGGVSHRELPGGDRPVNFPGSNITPAAFYETAQGTSPRFRGKNISLQGLTDRIPIAQENTQPGNGLDDSHLFGLSDNEYLAQHIVGDAAAGYFVGDVGKKLANKFSKAAPLQVASGKPKDFVSADAEELGRRITEHRQQTGGQKHPFERLGKYDATTGRFTLNPNLGVDRVTVHKTRPIVWRPEGRAGDTWPSLDRQKRAGDTSTQNAASTRKKFRSDMGKLMGDAITEYRRTTGKPSPLEQLGKYDPSTGTFKLDSKYAAGHTTSAHNNGRDMFAVEEGGPNSWDGREREHPAKGGEVLRKRAVDIHGFPIEKELARKLFPDLAENAPSHPGWTRGVKVTHNSLDVFRDHLLKTELQNLNPKSPEEKAHAQELSRKFATGEVTDADLTDPKNKKLFESLREKLKELDEAEKKAAAASGRKPKPSKLSLEDMLDAPTRSLSQRTRFDELLGFYASYTRALRDSANDRKNAKKQSATKPEGTRPGTSNLNTDANGSRSPQARGDKSGLIVHRDKPDEANPKKKRSVNPADRSPRQSQKDRGLRPRDESPTPRREESRSSKPKANSPGASSPQRQSPPSRSESPKPQPQRGQPSLRQTTSLAEPKIDKPKSSVIPNGIKNGAKSFARGAGKVFKPLGFAVDAYELGDAIYRDGGIGENTKKVVKEGAISWGSAAAGAGIGAAVAGPPGALVGGIVGGLAPVAVEYAPKIAKNVGSWVSGLFD